MRQREDPFAALPFAVAGLLVGIGLSVLCGQIVLDRWAANPATRSSGEAVVEGTVEWAGWRKSAHPDGPVWFLQLRLSTDPRGFLVAASDLTEALRAELRRVGPRKNGNRLPSLIGTEATIGMAPRFQERPRPPTPYVRTLQVDGTVVVASGSSREANEPYGPIAVFVIGVGGLVGLGVTGVSGHHLVLCVRHRTAEA